MQHLEDRAKADGITVPLVGNNNGTFNSGVAALGVDAADSYPQGSTAATPPSGMAYRISAMTTSPESLWRQPSSRAAPSTPGEVRDTTSALN